MADPVRSNTTYTWDPVSQSWVHERGETGTKPPVPPDVHALQTYFWDPDSRRWTRTLLGSLGQQLAAKWPGAHREPDVILGTDDERRLAAIRVQQGQRQKTSPFGFVIVAVVLAGSVGGAALVASQQGQSSSIDPSASPSVAASSGSVPVAASAPASAPADATPATPAPTQAAPAPTQAPVVTRAPTPRPATPAPGPGALPDGTVITYTGPVTTTRGNTLAATFTVTAPNGTPAVGGSLGVILGDPNGSPKIVSGAPIINGRVNAQISITVPAGGYPLVVNYGPYSVRLGTIAVR